MRDVDFHISLEMSTDLSLEVVSILRSPCFAAKKTMFVAGFNLLAE